jgi:hypothetical protein
VRFRGAVDHSLDPVISQQRRHHRLVANVTLVERIPRMPLEILHIRRVARIGQRIKIDYLVPFLYDKPTDKMGTDEAGSAGDQQLHRQMVTLLIMTRRILREQAPYLAFLAFSASRRATGHYTGWRVGGLA